MQRPSNPEVILARTLKAAAGRDRPLQVVEDRETGRADRIVNDVAAIWFDPGEKHLEIGLRFRRPFPEMMFEAADLYFDCDDDAKTGISGAELRVRVGVGSRFHPNSFAPKTEGAKPPLSRLKAAYALVTSHKIGAKEQKSTTWTWKGHLPAPTVDGKELRFRVPLRLITESGRRYNRHVPVWARVEGSCSENPIPLLHTATDGGTGVFVDGKDGDWSGGTRAEDETGELHRDAAALDIRRVQVDHGKDTLAVGVWLAKKGFGRPIDATDDIDDLDRVVVAVEPIGSQYEGYREYLIHTKTPRIDRPGFEAVAGDRFVEVQVRRAAEQSSFRVIVWADALRIDRVPDSGSFRLDLSPRKRR